MNASELTEISTFAISLARKAGDIIRSSSEKRDALSTSTLDSKKNRVDLVTETDQAVEKFVLAEIHARYPSHEFIGEESYAAGSRPEFTDAPTWIVDPVDGTTNFVHRFDHVCISIGFTVGREPVVGVIYNPFLDKLYSAVAGQGAFLNETTRLPLTRPAVALDSISDALIGVEWGSDRGTAVMHGKSTTYARLAGDPASVPGGLMAHSLRSIGSAALNFAYVAAGQLDAYWEVGCWAWDVCAGVILAREAGARVFAQDGSEFKAEDLFNHHYFVVRAVPDANKVSQEELAKEFFSAVEKWY